MHHRRHFYVSRTVILGVCVFLVSVLSGIAMIFSREYGTDLSQMPSSAARQLLVQATLGPIFMAVYFLWPMTMVLIPMLIVMAYIGSRLRRVWISAVSFMLMGLYWLWMVKLIADGSFD